MNSTQDQNPRKIKTKGWVYAAVLMAMAITLSCSLTQGLFSRQTQVPHSDAPLGLIAYVGIDGNIYTIDRFGKQQTAITQDANMSPASGEAGRIYQYLTWAPDGRRLAYVGITGSLQAGTQATLYTSSSDGNKRIEAFSSQDILPFYLFWSPNSEFVTFLGNAIGGNELVLYMAAAAGGNSKLIGSGQPFYWDWSPDNQTIIVHTGGAASDNPDARMALFDMTGSMQIKQLDLKPGLFQAPAWSPRGDELVLISQSGSGVEELVLTGRDGTVKRVLAQLSGPVAFAWSPKGDNLAYTTSVEGDSTGLLKRLVLLDPARPDRFKEIAQGVVVAFFWSPDSQKIASLQLGIQGPSGISQTLPQGTSRVAIQVQVYDLGSGETKQVMAFTPTDSFQQVFPFFDQYQRSGTIWSPDSKNLVIAGVDNNQGSSIFVVSADGGQPQKIANGDLAFWSWK